MSVVFVYVTASSVEEAREIADTLVEEKLAACANIMPGMTSVYSWRGEIKSSEEVVVILKTRLDLFTDVEERVRELHSYDNPCIVALPVAAGSETFLDWVMRETGG